MAKILKSMHTPDLLIEPPIKAAVTLSTDMQQTLALLSAYYQSKRIPLTCSPTGVLNVCSSRLADIIHYTGSGANDTQTGVNTPCTEVLIMAHPDNTDKIWVRSDKTATDSNAWPLSAGDVVSFVVTNLAQLNMLFVADGDRVITALTR